MEIDPVCKMTVDPDMAPVNFSMKPGGKIRIRVVDENGKVVRTQINESSGYPQLDDAHRLDETELFGLASPRVVL